MKNASEKEPIYPHLFSQGNIGRLTLQNRVVMAPMGVCLANLDGTPSEQLIDYYEERAKNGVALIITGICRVNDLTGAAAPRQESLSRDIHIKAFARAARRVQRHGTKLIPQLHHPGRQNVSLMMYGWPLLQRIGAIWPEMVSKSFEKQGEMLQNLVAKYGGPAVVAPSAVPCGYVRQRTRALTGFEVRWLIKDFIRAAKRAQLAGLDGVMLHATHGYLIQQFLSPHTNKRRDIYGGSFDNRLRFLREIIQGIRESCGKDFPLLVRLTVDEFYRCIDEQDRGIELEEGVRMAKALEQLGIDAFDISSGTYETINWWLEPTTFKPGWRKNLAAAVKQQVNIPVIAANLIRSPAQAEAQLAEGIQDFIALGRPLLADPEWVAKAREGREGEITRCIMCCHCFESLTEKAAKCQTLECSLNPRLGHEGEMAAFPADTDPSARPVAIIGAGPAGLTAAEMLGRRGIKSVVWEQEPEVGGQVQLAAATPDKENIAWCYEDLKRKAEKYGAEIRLGKTADIDALKKINPRAVIVATGGSPVVPPIIGVEQTHVCTTTDILSGCVRLQNKRVAVIGSGLTGLETAKKLAAEGNEILVVEMLDEIGPNGNRQHIEDALLRLKKYNPVYLSSHKLMEIGENHVVLEDTKRGGTSEYTADAVVLAVGVHSNNEISSELRNHFARVIEVGDARNAGNISDAVHAAFQAAWNL